MPLRTLQGTSGPTVGSTDLTKSYECGVFEEQRAQDIVPKSTQNNFHFSQMWRKTLTLLLYKRELFVPTHLRRHITVVSAEEDRNNNI